MQNPHDHFCTKCRKKWACDVVRHCERDEGFECWECVCRAEGIEFNEFGKD